MTDVTALPDAAHRGVIDGSTPGALARTVFVDAGAGTGKTTALVRRVANLVATGVPIQRIAAITFTEAAAAELRHRVRTQLEADRDTGRGDPALLEPALAELDDATFSTLHAFAMGILLDHPLESGLPPAVEVLGEIEEAAEFEERWDAWLAAFVSRPEIEPVLTHLDLLGITIPAVRKLARNLHEHYHRVPAELRTPPTIYQVPPLDVGGLRQQATVLRAHANHGAATDPSDKLVANLENAIGLVDRLAAEVDDGADLAVQLQHLDEIHAARLPGAAGSAKVWGEQKATVKEARDMLRPLVEAVYTAQYDHLLRALTAWVAEFVLGWQADRKSRGQLVFQDLLVLARDVLRDDPGVRARVRARYDHLLIDEFQDTDPLQIEIAVLLAAIDHDAIAAAPASDGSVPWEDATLEPGRLFFVGDPKQSIYAFRGADIRVYEGARTFASSDGSDNQLTHNFRSVPGVLAWVNEAFEHLFVPRHRAQPTYHRLTGHRPAVATGGPTVRWFGGRHESTAQDMREQEARDTVRAVQHLVGTATVTDPETGEPRRARARDIAVLVRRHSTARQLERHFDDAGLPLVVEARSLIFSTDEVRELTTLLTAIEDDSDQVALLGALRQPALGCSDTDLATWVNQGGRWELPEVERVSEPDVERVLEHPVGAALHRLAVLRQDRWTTSVGGFVERIIADLDLQEIALARPRHRDRWRRLRFVADQAHAFHDAGGTLRGFVRWLREQADEGVRRDEHVVTDRDDDAVHVTTVHAAKGLEYPIVIALGLDMDVSKPLHLPVLAWDEAGGMEVNISSDAKTAGYQQLKDEIKARHREEERRLLYVETTRARDLLVVSRHHSIGTSHAADLAEVTGLDKYWSELTTEPAPAPTTGVATTSPPAGVAAPSSSADRAAAIAAHAARHAEAHAAATRPRVLAATGVASAIAAADTSLGTPGGEPDDLDSDADTTEVPTDTQPWRRGRAGSAVGRAVHAVLQSVDLATFDDVDALARAQCAAEGLPPTDAPAVARMARRAGTAPIVRAAVAAGTFWREIHVGAPVALSTGDTITLEGFIDLLVEVDGELVIVDYKTDRVGDRSPEQVVATYRPQAATYALALEASLGRPVTRAVFVLTGTPGSADPQVEVAGDDLATARADLLTGLAKVR